MRKRFKIGGTIIALVVLIIVGGVLIFGMTYYTYAFKSMVIKSGEVNIPTGITTDSQAVILFNNGFIKDSTDYKIIANKMGFKNAVSGRYAIKKGMTYRSLLNALRGGAQVPVKLTFNNIRNFERLAGVVSTYIEPDSATLLKAFRNDSIIKSYGLTQQTFISMFIPNTYEFYWNTSAEKFIAKMASENAKFWNSDREAKRAELGLTKEEVSTLASIVVEETKSAKEMPKVAGVYINRLKNRMPLQADPTVKFALGDPTLKRILYKHLEVESPYNTYKNGGLPPGPIYMSPINAIDAVLNYDRHTYLYFCASPELNGLHLFAKSLSEHSKNAAAYAAALNRAGIR